MSPFSVEPLERRMLLSGTLAAQYTFVPRYTTQNHEVASVDLPAPDLGVFKRVAVGTTTLDDGKTDLVFTRLVSDRPDFYHFALDGSFGIGGILTVSLRGSSVPFTLNVRDDGKVVAVGQTRRGNQTLNLIVRLTADGFLDKSFGDGGIVTFSLDHTLAQFNAIAFSGGKTIVVGTAAGDIVVARFKDNGTLDHSFGGHGFVRENLGGNDTAYGVDVDAEGRIVVAGAANFGGTAGEMVALRYRKNGHLDKRFADHGELLLDYGPYSDEAYCTTIDSAGRVLLGGSIGDKTASHPAVVRLTASGTIDSGFGQDGWWIGTSQGGGVTYITQDASGYAIGSGQQGQSTGQIPFDGVGGWLYSPFDDYFPRQDRVLSAGQFVGDVQKMPDGKLLMVVSQANGFVVTRLKQNGTTDRTFGVDGWSDSYVAASTNWGEEIGGGHAIQLLPDGSFLVLGDHMSFYGTGVTNGLALAKYLPNGHFDQSFGNAGVVEIVESDDTFGLQLGVEPNGKILASSFTAGGGHTQIFQFDSDGTLDPLGNYTAELSKQRPGYYDESARTFWIADSGDITISGFLYSSQEYYSIRIHADGSPVTSFGTNGLRLDPQNFLGRPSDPLGTMLRDGTYLYASTSQTSVTVVRHDANGQLDTSFGTNGRTTVAIDDWPNYQEALLEDDGKLLLTGFSFKSDNTRQLYVVRLTADGQPDSNFGTGGVDYFPVGSYGAIERVQQVGQTLQVLTTSNYYFTIGPETFQLIDFALSTAQPDLPGCRFGPRWRRMGEAPWMA